jgi:hypothetical protein
VSVRLIGNFVSGRIRFHAWFVICRRRAVFFYLLILVELSKQCAHKSRFMTMWHNGCTCLVGSSLPIVVCCLFSTVFEILFELSCFCVAFEDRSDLLYAFFFRRFNSLFVSKPRAAGCLGSAEGKPRIVSEAKETKAVGQTVRTEWRRIGYPKHEKSTGYQRLQ